MTLDRAVDLARLAEAAWTDAVNAHISAEPNPGFVGRLRTLAAAAAKQRDALSYAADEGLVWQPVSPTPGGRPAPAELSPMADRVGPRRIGPRELWRRFDDAYAAWDRSLEGTSLRDVANAFGAVSDAASALADAIEALLDAAASETERGTARSSDEERRSQAG